MTDPGDRILNALRTLTGDPDAILRPDQRRAIELLTEEHRKLLLVQRTGWGKSAVYFIATKILRDEGFGPTLVISPLLALMRNQIQAAERLGIRALTINSASESTVQDLRVELRANAVDLLVVSPERLANPEFAEEIMPVLGSRPGLTVIDEVHCISDWGHDFRPDYRRIGQMLAGFPADLPILGCTATANQRVIDDVEEQLGGNAVVLRGELARTGLSLHVVDLAEPADRLVWLSTHLDSLPGSGIIYCLTKRDVEVVASWLREAGIATKHYHGALDSDERENLEEELSNGTLKVIVATSALGMGYDNPRIGFVVHFQSPGSVVHYYQQVGRAGRAMNASMGILLHGGEDDDIIEWFIATAFPTEQNVAAILGVLEQADGPLSTARVEAAVNIPRGRIASALKQLDVEGVVRRVSAQRFERTLKPWAYPADRVAAVAETRRHERDEMVAYMNAKRCRMEFLVAALDGKLDAPCGICDICSGERFTGDLDATLVIRAQTFLDRMFGIIEPRAKDGHGSTIPPGERLEEGRFLCRFGDAGYGKRVKHGKQVSGRFDDVLVDALVDMVAEWRPSPPPHVVACVPSRSHPEMVIDLAQRVADGLGIPFVNLVERIHLRQPQKVMENSAHQFANVEGAFALRSEAFGAVELGPVLLIDDVVDSRWTMTEIGRLLRRSGFPAVFPLALASSSRA